MQQEKLKQIFELYTSDKKNWKESHTVEFQNHTDSIKARNTIQSDAKNVEEAFIHFTGGAEVKNISPDHIIVSTKGYYHYIGA